MHENPPKVPPPTPSGRIQYRLYFFNGGAHIVKSHEFEAKDDEAAIKIAEGWREGRRVELWQGKRVVKFWS